MEKTNYGFWKIVDYQFDEAIEKVTEALETEGFGVLTDLDFKAILKNKLDVDYKPYRVLAVCNPPSAYKVLQSEEQIGLMLPCNIIIYENDNNKIVIAAIDPVENMKEIDNATVQEVATLIKSKLSSVIERV